MKLLIIFISVLTVGISDFTPHKTNKFEGIITFKRETLSDTCYFEYLIKGKLVRINNLSKNKKLITYKIINIKEGTISIVKPSKKLYIQKPINKKTSEKVNDIDIKNTGNYKFIGKYKSFQWIVKDKKKKTVFTYWMANCGYDYYYDLVSFSSDKFSKYFKKIPKTNGSMPLICEERSNLRTKRMTFSAVNIIEKNINDAQFQIPDDYSIFE